MATPIRTRSQDTQRENLVFTHLQQAWDCNIVRTGYLDEWDGFAVKNGRSVAVLELKNRNVSRTAYPTLYVSAHKWWRLLNLGREMNVAPLFIANYTDALAYIDLRHVDARAHQILGRTDRKNAPSDLEPMILVPVEDLKVIHEWPAERLAA
jgi:hypothetical protein